MKVCFFINTLNNSGGTERVTTVIANQFNKVGYDTTIICWYGGVTSFYPLDKGVKVEYIFKSGEGNIYKDYLKSLYIYKKLLKKLSPDYLIDVCVALSLLSIPAVINRKIKIIAWEHFNTEVSWNSFTAKLSRTLVAKFAYAIVTLTEGDKCNYKNKFNAKTVFCIPNPVTINAPGRADLSQKNVLSIGRFTHQKGFDLLLPIWKNVASKYSDWRLRIIGDGELKNEILLLATTLKITDSIDFIAPTLNVTDYYLTSAIYVMTSRFEGLPLVLIEAKAFGLPVISYDCETGPRDIINNGNDGILVPYLDAGTFEKELITLISDMEQRITFSNYGIKDSVRFELEPILKQWFSIIL